MRKISYVTYLVFGIISFLAMIQSVIKQDMKLFGIACFVTFFCLLIAFIAEPRTRETDSDKKHDDKCQSWGLGMLMLITITALLAVFTTSCSANKYGCGHGAPKQNWNKMVRRINSPY